MSIGPGSSLKKVVEMIRDGVFCPDATRSNYFPNVMSTAAGTPTHVVMQPFTPALIERRQPGTPGLEPHAVGQAVPAKEVPAQTPATEEVKSERSWSVIQPGSSGQVIEISSDEDSESSDSDTCPGTSSDDDPIDLDEEEEAACSVPEKADVAEPGLLRAVACRMWRSKALTTSRCTWLVS